MSVDRSETDRTWRPAIHVDEAVHWDDRQPEERQQCKWGGDSNTELVDPQLGRFGTHVSVDEAGHDSHATNVDDLVSVAPSLTSDYAAGDG